MIYLMRHGEDNESFIGGWSNGFLTPTGIVHVYNTSIWLKENLKISNILSSDIIRAKQTAQIVKTNLNVPLTYSSNLREQNKVF